MPEPYTGIAPKLKRGIEHLKELRGEINTFLESDANGVVTDFDSEPGCLLVKAFVGNDPPPRFGILIGEILYHFRSTLDHLACELTKANNQPVDRNVEFPIFDDPRRFSSNGNLTAAIQKRIGGIHPAKQVVIEREQPFKEIHGPPHDDPLWLLYELSNFDRHQALHLMNAYTDESSIELRPPEARGRFVELERFYGPLKEERTIARFAILQGPEFDVEVRANVRLDVSFGQSGPCPGRPVLYTLGDIGMRVGKIIEKLY